MLHCSVSLDLQQAHPGLYLRGFTGRLVGLLHRDPIKLSGVLLFANTNVFTVPKNASRESVQLMRTHWLLLAPSKRMPHLDTPRVAH